MSQLLKPLAAALTFWRNLGTSQKWRLALAVPAIGLVVWLLLADKPWEIAAGIQTKFKVRHYVGIWTWWAALADVIILAGLILLTPWWARPLRRQEAPAPRGGPKWFWPVVFAAVTLSAIFSFPRLSHSLWDDEELTARQAVIGAYKMGDGSKVAKFLPATWQDTFYDYRTPNNHALHSLLARLSTEGWRVLARPDGLPFNEFAMRLPAFLFGIFSVAALALFLREYGFPEAGAIAAFFLALHPWHIRYTSEARGYSMVLCLIPILFILWRRAFLWGEWKWWAAAAATQLAILYTYPGMLFYLLSLNGLTLLALWLSKNAAKPFLAQTGRWFCTNALAALPAIILILPHIPQAKIYFEFDAKQNFVADWAWVKRAFSFTLTGSPFSGGGDGCPPFGLLFAAQPIVAWIFVLTVAALILIGLGRFLKIGWLAFFVTVPTLLTPVLTVLMSRAKHYMLYESYVIYALPGLIGLAAVGTAAIALMIARKPWGHLPAIAWSGAIVVGFAIVTQPSRGWLTNHPLQQIRESVVASRGSLNPREATYTDRLVASFCIPPYLYDAAMVRLNSADEFIAILRRSDRENKPLFFNIGMPWAAKAYSPKMWAMLNESRLFDGRQRFPGFDEGLDRLVFHYRPGSADAFDFTAYSGSDR